MTFVQLFDMYRAFLEGNSLRHSDLVNPIREFAAKHQHTTHTVIENLRTMYRHN